MKAFLDSVGGSKLAAAGGIIAVGIYIVTFVVVCAVISAA